MKKMLYLCTLLTLLLMNYRFLRYIHHFSLSVCLLGAVFCANSCTPFREAHTTIAYVDSLDARGCFFTDTAALNEVISTLNNPLGRTFERTTLANAYYYLGRVYDDSLDCVREAADCYIACDQLQADDNFHRGRANTCMAYICMRQRADDIALVYCRRAADLLSNTSYDWLYAHSLLNMCSTLLELNRPAEADSVWHLAAAFAVDSAYLGRLVGLRGVCLYAQHRYDSALIYLERAFHYPIYEGQRCFYNTQRMLIHNAQNHTDSALYYAHYVAEQSSNPSYLEQAYSTIIRQARANNDAATSNRFSDLNADNIRILRDNEAHYAVAIDALKRYIDTPYPFRPWQIAIAILVVLAGFFWAVSMILHKKQKLNIEYKDKVIEAQEQQLQRREKEHKQEINRITRARADAASLSAHKMSEFLSGVNRLHNLYDVPRKEWNTNYLLFKRDTQVPFAYLVGQLEQLELSKKEIRFCVYTILYKGISAAQMAAYLYYSTSGIRTFKQRVAHKLGTIAPALYDTLLCMAMAENK